MTLSPWYFYRDKIIRDNVKVGNEGVCFRFTQRGLLQVGSKLFNLLMLFGINDNMYTCCSRIPRGRSPVQYDPRVPSTPGTGERMLVLLSVNVYTR